ncbi:MAG: hypothetical protein LAP86_00535 [Acidobacteriia bacterium]|nr:hypothetical protein [Terriglobia bacterium]
MKPKALFAILVLFAYGLIAAPAEKQDWTNYVRIGAYGLKGGDAAEIVRRAQESGVSGIEVDNDIPGRYESFLHPEAKLKAIRDVAVAAHKVGNHAFVYIAGTECITAHGDKVEHTMAKDHPDWLQRKITGEPAIFGGGTAFWIAPGDEDVWVSPYATEWRKIYMERVREIAGTGIDGIYVDIPYWMTHFEGWENTWASFDDYTVAEFKQKTGLDAKHDVRIGDFSDAGFRKWVEFRIQTFTDFMAEIDHTAKAVNPEIKTIPEIYPGIEEEAVRVGADVYSLYPVVDAIAHEYEFGSGDHMASSRKPLDWFRYQVGMHSFRAFAQGKATWILNYSWDGDKVVDKREAMMNLAMSQIMVGANFWDAPGHSMAGSNDLLTRKKIFDWIGEHEKTFYLPRAPIDPIGVYFSPETRNLYAEDFLASYRGILILLMQKHLEFQIVTPRTLAEFHGETLVLPDVRVLGRSEKEWLKKFAATKKLVVTGTDATELGDMSNIVRVRECPGKAYNVAIEKDFEHSSPDSAREFFASVRGADAVRIHASPQIATSIARTSDGHISVFLANFAGLRGGSNPVQTPQDGVEVTVQAKAEGKGFFLPFLGQVQAVKGERSGESIRFTLPTISRGAVFWFEP